MTIPAVASSRHQRGRRRLARLAGALATSLACATVPGIGQPLLIDGFDSGSNCAWSGGAFDFAQPIGFSPVVGTTVGGSTSISGSCLDPSGAERVFALTAPSIGTLTVRLDPLGRADLAVYLRSSCAPADELLCLDGAPEGAQESGEIELASAQTVFVFVDGVAGDAGDFELDLDFALCLNGVQETGEECDDGNLEETDGCTSQCEAGPVCTSAAIAGGDRFAVDPANATCYVAFDSDPTNHADAQAACSGIGGHLATITGSGEQDRVASIHDVGQTVWLGATDAVVEGSFAWVTAEPFSYANWLAGEPDDNSGSGGNGDCVAIASGSAVAPWMDTVCLDVGFVTGRICELPAP